MSVKDEFVYYCNKVYEKGFVAATDGNLSLRIDDNRFLITPSGKSKGELKPQDILTIDANQNILEGSGRVTTEAKIHLLVYRERKEINSVIHCHPVHATAIAMTENLFDKPYLPEVLLILGKVPLCNYGTPSTNELPESMQPHIKNSNVFLLQNHGAVTIGNSIKQAYLRMEKLEQASQILITAKQIGKIHQIPKEKVEQLYSIAYDTYGINLDENEKLL